MNRDRERTFVYFVQLAHRGKGEKKNEKGVDLASCTGKIEKPHVQGDCHRN